MMKLKGSICALFAPITGGAVDAAAPKAIVDCRSLGGPIDLVKVGTTNESSTW